MKHIKTIVLYSLLILLGFSACKKNKKTAEDDPNDPTTTTTPTGTFDLHLHTYIGSSEVDAYNIVYTDDNGRKMFVSMAQLYISDIQLVKLDGSTFNFTGKKVLKLLEFESYIVGEAPVGNYKSIRFKVGLDAATNQLSPTTPSDSALLNKPAMWFSSSVQPDGYVFMNVQGKIDTTADASGTNAQMQPFTFKIGTNANYKQVTMPDKNFSIVPDQVQFGHIIIDYTKLFNGLQLYQPANFSVTTAAANASAPATTIANNIPQMFFYEQ